MIPRKRWHELVDCWGGVNPPLKKINVTSKLPQRNKPVRIKWFVPKEHGRCMLYLHACKTGKRKIARRMYRKLQSYLPWRQNEAQFILESIHFLLQEGTDVHNKVRH